MDFISIVSVQRLTDHLLNIVYRKKNIAKLESESCDTEIFKTSAASELSIKTKILMEIQFTVVSTVYHNFIVKL